jgi:hypothetical protein
MAWQRSAEMAFSDVLDIAIRLSVSAGPDELATALAMWRGDQPGAVKRQAVEP